MVSVWNCSHPELSMKQLNQEFVTYPHYIVYNFEVVLVKKDLSVTSGLMINISHIQISVAINDSLTGEPSFLHNQDPEWLIEEFVAELVKQREIIFDEVIKMYLMVDEDSLPSRVQSTWTNWLSQVPVFGFNSGKYDLNMVKYYFVKTISHFISNFKATKKDNSYMFLITYLV